MFRVADEFREPFLEALDVWVRSGIMQATSVNPEP